MSSRDSGSGTSLSWRPYTVRITRTLFARLFSPILFPKRGNSGERNTDDTYYEKKKTNIKEQWRCLRLFISLRSEPYHAKAWMFARLTWIGCPTKRDAPGPHQWNTTSS